MHTHSHTHIHIITYAALGKSRGAKLQVGGGDGGGGWGLGATKTKTWNENWCRAMGQQWLCGDGGGFQGTMGWRRTLRILLCAFVVGLWSAPQVARMLHIQNQNRIYYARAGVAWCVCVCVWVCGTIDVCRLWLHKSPAWHVLHWGEGVGSQVKPVRCSLRKMQPLKKEKPNQTKTSTTTNGI